MARTRRSGRTAAPEIDLREGQLHAYDEAYLLCRDVRHAWVIEGFYRNGHEGVRRRLHCIRCTTTRTDSLKVNGMRIKNQYSYPEGYRLPGGVEAQTVRAEQLRRLPVFEDEEAMIASLFEKKPRRSRRNA